MDESEAKQFKVRFSGPGMRWSRPGLERLLPIRSGLMFTFRPITETHPLLAEVLTSCYKYGIFFALIVTECSFVTLTNP